jgi:glutathione synthase/RimK-type ligase-like ATP-grasp enzyme
MNHLIILDSPSEWKIKIPGVEVYSARDYLTREEFRKRRNVKVYNLCKSYRYQTLGYYVSLLASARGHKPIPSVSTIQDLKSQPIVKSISEDLDDLIQSSLDGLKSPDFTLSIYFGQNVAKKYDRLCSQLFMLFQAPFLRAHFQLQADQRWHLQSVKPISAIEIPENHYPYIEGFAHSFFKSRRISNRKKVTYSYDLAILYNPEEEMPPSDEKALAHFIKAGNQLGLAVELITKEEFGRLAEFDALFIRETTSVNHHTYKFARKAKAEGLVVIDDPDSILKCTNKIYLSELLDAHRIKTPKTIIAHRDNISEVQEKIGFPCILKQPDSAFSQGVKKAKNRDEFIEHLENFWSKSDLVIAQEFLPTDFDWRIGIIDKTPFFACKYFMAKDHWQIVKTADSGKHLDGRVQAVPFEEVPKHVFNTALKAANLIGDGLYGVDLKEIQGKAYVIEINDNPNLDHGYEDSILKMDLYNIIMKVFFDRIEKKKQRVSP